MADLSKLKCKQCGAPLDQSAVINGMICCKYCGEMMIVETPKPAYKETPVEAEGIYKEVRQSQQQSPQYYVPVSRYETKSRSVAILLAFFLGCWGGHWFYLNQTKKATIMLIIGFFGFFLILPLLFTCVWALVDFIKLLTMSDKIFNETYNCIF